ncbi:MAG: sacsin N-terminal ATP-binding-like domain-containing protein [Nitrososphaerales archaeon]
MVVRRACSVCGGEVQGEGHPDGKGRFFCEKHAPEVFRYGTDFFDWLKTKIQESLSQPEPRIFSVARELVQNADDEKAHIVVFRFEQDALYVANDGEPFSYNPEGRDKGEPDDFFRIARVLKRYKEEDKYSTGYFGSGFQSVYTLTNEPEIHSNDHTEDLLPARDEARVTSARLHSPYSSNESARRGVLFRLQWRTDAEAERVFDDGERHFADRAYPRWDSKKEKSEYDQLKDYLPALLLCCQNLKAIRAVWARGGECEAYEAWRDFDLDPKTRDPRVVHMTYGRLKVTKDWAAWDRGDVRPARVPRSFDEGAVSFEESREDTYVTACGEVRDPSHKVVHLVKGADQRVRIDYSAANQYKLNTVHVLLPIDFGEEPPKSASLYNIIPLPEKSKNSFVFTAHLIPQQERKGVAIEGGDEGVNKRWYQYCLSSVAELYESTFGALVDLVKASKETPAGKLRAVLRNLPRVEIGQWMRPAADEQERAWAKKESGELFERLFGKPIIPEDGRWVAPDHAYLADSLEARDALSALGLAPFPEPLLGLRNSVEWLGVKTEARRLTPDVFAGLWDSILNCNRQSTADSHGLRLDASIILPWANSRIQLSKDVLKPLIVYALKSQAASSLDIIPGADGVLRRKDQYKIFPPEVAEAEALLPDSWRLHPDLDAVVRDAADPVFPEEIPEIISNAAAAQKKKFEHLSPENHRTLSRTLVGIVLRLPFARKSAVGKTFLPCKYRGGHVLAPLFDIKKEQEGRGEYYQREWVFGKRRYSVEGLPEAIENQILSLDLVGVRDEDAREIERQLGLVSLAQRPKELTDYVRHFLSPLHGTLFDDKNLGRFVGTHDRTVIEELKHEMLPALQAYFNSPKTEKQTMLDPDSMGGVPCLYDQKPEWHKAKDFALGASIFASILEKKTLHRDFLDQKAWPIPTLEALGVKVKVEPKDIAGQIGELVKAPKVSRIRLADLFGAVVTMFPQESLEEFRNNTSGYNWIPVVGGDGLANPSDALIPTEPNKQTLGDHFRSLVDYEAVEKKARERLQSGDANIIEAVAKLGIRKEPTPIELLEALENSARLGREPPSKLIERLVQAIDQNGFNKEGVDRILGAKFWWKGRWWERGRIRVLDRSPTESAPLENLAILSTKEAFPLSPYLRILGVRSGLTVEDRLNSLVELAERWNQRGASKAEIRTKAAETWKEIESQEAEIHEGLRDAYGKKSILLTGDCWGTPSDAIIIPGGTPARPSQTLGPTTILPDSWSAVKALARLGAHRIEEMDGGTARQLLDQAEAGPLTPEQSEAYQAVAVFGASRNWWSQERPLRLPRSERRSLTLALPRGSYLGNAVVGRIFQAVPILMTSSHRGLERMCVAWGAKEVDKEVRYAGLAEEGSLGLEGVLSRTWRHLVKRFPEYRDSLDWLRSVEVMSTTLQFGEYAVGSYGGKFPLPSLVPFSSGRVCYLARKGQDMVSTEDSGMFAEWAVASGFPADKQELIINTILLVQEAPEPVEEPEDANEVGEYNDTVDTLQRMYGGCQVCTRVTPANDEGVKTREKMKSVISERGGLYPGKKGAYEVANSLYLCPTHQALAERGLMKFKQVPADWQRRKEEVMENLDALAQQAEDTPEDSPFSLTVMVFAWTVGQPPDWYPENMKIRPSHAKALFERLKLYVEET